MALGLGGGVEGWRGEMLGTGNALLHSTGDPPGFRFDLFPKWVIGGRIGELGNKL